MAIRRKHLFFVKSGLRDFCFSETGADVFFVSCQLQCVELHVASSCSSPKLLPMDSQTEAVAMSAPSPAISVTKWVPCKMVLKRYPEKSQKKKQ